MEAVELLIEPCDPSEPGVREVLDRHLAFARAHSPAVHVHAMDHAALADPEVDLFCARQGALVVGVGALHHVEEGHAELKSMHTAEEFRGRGVGRAMLRFLLAEAAARGYTRVSLETGSMDAFAPARELYAGMGFRPCAPFAQYTVNPYSTCMTLELKSAG